MMACSCRANCSCCSAPMPSSAGAREPAARCSVQECMHCNASGLVAWHNTVRAFRGSGVSGQVCRESAPRARYSAELMATATPPFARRDVPASRRSELALWGGAPGTEKAVVLHAIFQKGGPGGAPARQGPANVRAPAGGKSATEAHARGSRAVRACAQSAPAWRSHSAQSARRASAKPRAGQQVRRGDRGRSGAHRPEHGHAPRPPLTMQSSRSARPAWAARLHGSPSSSTAPSLGGRKP